MQQWRRFLGGLFCLVATAMLVLAIGGCSDDLYASCSIGTNCGGDDEEAVSCVEEQNLQCETQVCARYKGSDAFCTTTCQEDGDCAAGKCRQFPFGSETSYCVEDTDV